MRVYFWCYKIYSYKTTSETIFASHRPLSASTSTNSSEPTTLLAFQSNSSAVSHARYSPVYASCNPKESSTAISNQKIYFSAILAELTFESSILAVLAKRMRRCIRTSSRVSTVHLRSFSEVTMVLVLTCGVSDAFLQNFSPDTLSSLEKMSKSNLRVLWRSSARPLATSSRKPREENFSSIRHSSLVLQCQVKAEGDGPVARLLVVPSSAKMRLSWTSSLSVFDGTLRSVCVQTRPCLTPSSLMSLSEKLDLSVHVQGLRHQLRRQPRPQRRNLQSSVYIQQIRPSRQCHHKQLRQPLVRVPYQIPQTRLRVMEAQQPLMSTIP